MLILNGKLFDPASKMEDEMVSARAHYLECVKALNDRYKKYGYLKLVRRKPIQKNKTGLLEPIPAIIFPAKVHIPAQFSLKAKQNERDQYGGMETWAYSKGSPIRKDGEYIHTPQSIKVFTQEMVLFLDRDIELIYFLLYKSQSVYYPEAVEKYGKRSGGDFILDDKDERERRIADGRKLASKLNAAIYGDKSSPLYEESTLRAVAAAWGVEGSLDEKATDDEVRNMLFADVEAKQKEKEKTGAGKGVEEFLEFINYDDAIRARALIIDAIDRKLVVYDKVKFTYIYASSNQPLLIIPDKAKTRKFDYLCDYLLSAPNAVAWEKFRREVIDVTYLDNRDFKWIKWLAKIEDIPVAAKSEEALREALKARYA